MNFEDFLTESTIRVDHSDYENSHGRKPGTHQNGNWMIGVGTNKIDHKQHVEGTHYVSHNGKLKDAVRKAKDIAQKRGLMSVHVLA